MTDTADAPDGGVPPPERRGLGADERAELEALRREIAELRRRPERSEQPGRARHQGRWRAPVASVLIVLGCILAPISVLGVWTANQVSDTGRYVTTMTPLIQDPAIQRALTDKITNAVVDGINVPSLTKRAATQLNQRGLPRVSSLLQNFSGSIASALQGFVHGKVAAIITSPAMVRTWVQANTVAHQELVKALSGRGGGAITTSNGEVVLNLAPFINVAKQDLAKQGLTFVNKLPTANVTLALFPSRDLVKAQTGYRLINDLKIVLPVLSLLLLAAGVYIARRHRRALVGAGLGFATSMLVLGLVLLIVRGAYLSAIPAGVLPSDAAAAAFDILVRFVRLALRTLLVAGLVVAAGAFLTGPSVSAVRIRSGLSGGLGWIRRSGENYGVSTGPVGRWTYAHRRGLRIGAVAVAAIIFIFWGRPTAAVVIWLAVLLVAALGLIELIGRPGPQRPPQVSES